MKSKPVELRETTPVRGTTSFFVKNGSFKTSILGGDSNQSIVGSTTGQSMKVNQHVQSGPIVTRKSRGLKQLWRKMKRSHSLHIPQQDQTDDDDKDNNCSVGSISCESLGKLSF